MQKKDRRGDFRQSEYPVAIKAGEVLSHKYHNSYSYGMAVSSIIHMTISKRELMIL